MTDNDQDQSPQNATMMIDPGELQQKIAAAEARKRAPIITGTPRLVGKSPVVSGQTFELTREKTTVGRGDANDIVINDGTVSQRHAQIVQEAGTWRVINLISTNGTSVNGQTNIVSYLAPGDVVSFGRVEMTFDGQTSGNETREVDARRGRVVDSAPKRSGSGKWIGIAVGVVVVVAAAGWYLLQAS